MIRIEDLKNGLYIRGLEGSVQIESVENVGLDAYRLYTLCERKGWARDVGQYNTLVLAWGAIEAAARSVG